jgi:hypothetical protein
LLEFRSGGVILSDDDVIFPVVGGEVLLKQVEFIDKVLRILNFGRKEMLLMVLLELFPQVVDLMVVLGDCLLY